LGIPERNAINVLPSQIGGRDVRFVILDDETDPAAAARNARRLVEQNQVDAIIGSTTVPTSIAAAEVAADNQTPIIPLAPFVPSAGQHAWTFPMAQPVSVMSSALFDHMSNNEVQTLAYIGFSDNWGEAWVQDIGPRSEALGIEVVRVERYARTDRTVSGQVLRILAAQPDAVLIGASGTPGVLPMSTLRERGYQGIIYQTHGMANQDVLGLAGSSGEGMILPTGAVLVAELLPEDHESKTMAVDFVQSYEMTHGAGSRNNFAAYAHDAYVQLDYAISNMDQSLEPGTLEFRQALREAIEATSELAVSHGVVNWGADSRNPFDERGAVLITVNNGAWAIVE
jgi:branched-chain amino acid transport system substrate-binding protein